MLWYKGWLESRFRWLFTLAFMIPMLLSISNGPRGTPASVRFVLSAQWVLVMALCVLVAGAGIVTQPALQATKGIHGSLLYTLSLPVSRLRLLAVRAGLGWMEMVVSLTLWYGALWTFMPVMRDVSSAQEFAAQLVAAIACASALYAVPVLLATFLDDQWRVWGSALTVGAFYWLSNRILESITSSGRGRGSRCCRIACPDGDGVLVGIGCGAVSLL
jgi:hypothetical protein